MSIVDAARARLRLIFRRDDAESRMQQEIAFHIEMETNRLMRDEQLAPSEARRRALVAFGGVEKHKEELRGARGLAWMSGLSLDLKIGFRMLTKYPGLTIVGCLAISTAIAVCTSYLELLNDTINPTMSGDFDQRIVRIRNFNVLTNKLDQHPLADFSTWRTELRSVEQLGAFTGIERNLVNTAGQSEPLRGVAISASAFRLLPVRPLLGRTLTDSDERLASPDVVLIGERIWRTRLASDANVIGKTIRLGVTPHTVIGVMPESFAFPVNYSMWVPLKLEVLSIRRGEGPMIGVFGRLAAGTTVETAQLELSNIGARASADFPQTNANVRPQVTRFLDALMAGGDPAEALVYYSINIFLILFLCVCGANVATLVFARTATREGEIAVRTALGASRGRIVAQLFCEGFALAIISGALGLGATALLLTRIRLAVENASGEQAPFWWDDRLSSRTLVYALVLTVVAAVLVGVLPALKATGRQIGVHLKRAASGNSSMRFGRLWTGIIVAQVALTVVFLMVVATIGLNMKTGRFVRNAFAFPSNGLLTFNSQMDGVPQSPDSLANEQQFLDNYRKSLNALSGRLLSDPDIFSITYASRLPSDDQARAAIEVDGMQRSSNGDITRVGVQTVRVGATFFETLNVPVTAGRSFAAGDTFAGRNAAIVDSRFVHRVLGDKNAIGVRFREVRFVGDNHDQLKFGPWREIVGVVNELAPVGYESGENGVVYQPASIESTYPTYVIARVQGDPHRYAARVRQLAADVDASVRLYGVVPFDETGASARLIFWSLMRVLAVIGAIALMLSTAGVHALMAFTVARRTREIGIRSALGANRNAIVRETFSRVFVQVGIGIVTGLIPGALIVGMGPENTGLGVQTSLITAATIVSLVIIVAMAASVLPVWRALRIEPTAALRQGG